MTFSKNGSPSDRTENAETCFNEQQILVKLASNVCVLQSDYVTLECSKSD